MFAILAQAAEERDTFSMILGGGCVLLVVIGAFYLVYGKR